MRVRARRAGGRTASSTVPPPSTRPTATEHGVRTALRDWQQAAFEGQQRTPAMIEFDDLIQQLDAIPAAGLRHLHDAASLVRGRPARAVSPYGELAWLVLAGIFHFQPRDMSTGKPFAWLESIYRVPAPPPDALSLIEAVAGASKTPAIRARLFDFLYVHGPAAQRFASAQAAVRDLLAAAHELAAARDGGTDAELYIVRAAEIARRLGRRRSDPSDLPASVFAGIHQLLGALESRGLEDSYFEVARGVSTIAASGRNADHDPLTVGSVRTGLPVVLERLAVRGNRALLVSAGHVLLEQLARLQGDVEDGFGWALRCAEKATADALAEQAPMARAWRLNEAAKVLRAVRRLYRDRDEVRRLRTLVEREMEAVGPTVRSSMQSRAVQFEVEPAPYAAAVREVLELAAARERLGAVVCGIRLPNRRALVEMVTRPAEDGGFIAHKLAPAQIVEHGRFIGQQGEIAQLEARAHDLFLLEVGQQADLFVGPALRRMFTEGRPAVREVVEALVAHALVPPARGPIVEAGLRAWYEGRPVEAVHVLAPQLEGCLREWVRVCGGRTTRYNKEVGAQHLKAVDPLLDDAMGLPDAPQDLLWLLRLVLSGAAIGGLNLRNQVAHGYADGGVCTDHAANLLVLCLLVLPRFTPVALGRTNAPVQPMPEITEDASLEETKLEQAAPRSRAPTRA